MNPLDKMTIAGWEASHVEDVSVQNHGSVVLFHPNTPAARRWIAANVADDAQWFGGALAVEPRYADSLVVSLVSDGLTIK